MTSPYPRYTMEEVRLNEYRNGEFPKTRAKVSPEDEAPDTAEEPTTCFGRINDCFGYTSAQGFERVQDSIYKKSKIRIIFWCLVVLAAFCVFGWQLHGLVLKFLSKPVTTKVSVINGKFIKFPAVTVCNLNMIRKSKLPEEVQEDITNVSTSYYNSSYSNSRRRRSLDRERRSFKLERFLVNRELPSVNRELPSVSRERQSLNRERRSTNDTWDYDTWDYDDDDYDSDNYYDDDDNDYGYGDADQDDCVDSECFGDDDNQHHLEELQKKMAYTLTQYNETELMKMGHQFSDFVVDCRWSGLNCKSGILKKYWKPYFDLTYGNCFTFNGQPASKNRKTLTLSKAGPTYGLHLRLNIEQNEYVEVVSPEAGARITIGNRGNMPFPTNEGFSVPPGRSSSVGIQTTNVIKVDAFNNKSCMTSNDLSKGSIYYKKHKARYTVETCLKSCVADEMFKKCGCTTYDFPDGKRTCNPQNQNKTDCTGNVYKAFLNSSLPCHKDCKELCKLSRYTRTVSTSEWPSNAELPQLTTELRASGKPTLEQYANNGSTVIRSNLLTVEVFFNDLSVFLIQEELLYGWQEFLAEVGGFIGLYIGVSVVTVIEFFELICFILCSPCRKKRPEPLPPNGHVISSSDTQLSKF